MNPQGQPQRTTSRWTFAHWLQHWHLHAAKGHLQQTLLGLDQGDLSRQVGELQFHLEGATHHLQVMLGEPGAARPPAGMWSLLLLHFHQEQLRSTTRQVLDVLHTRPAEPELRVSWNRLMQTRTLMLHHRSESWPPHG